MALEAEGIRQCSLKAMLVAFPLVLGDKIVCLIQSLLIFGDEIQSG